MLSPARDHALDPTKNSNRQENKSPDFPSARLVHRMNVSAQSIVFGSEFEKSIALTRHLSQINLRLVQ
jgi:hypothetical protein